jgi:uncharacterized protein YhaN
MLPGMERYAIDLMLEETAQNLSATESRVRAHNARIDRLEAAGRLAEAYIARQTLAVITETRDALRLRLDVARQFAAAAIRVSSD